MTKGDGVKRCFDWVKKGSCRKGEGCKFKHGEDSRGVKRKKCTEEGEGDKPKLEDGEKDCRSWKSKGKCRKGDGCPYRHDEGVRIKALAKKGGNGLCTPATAIDTKNRTGSTGVVMRGKIKGDIKRSQVERILKSLGAPKHKKVTAAVEEGKVEIVWTTKEKTEDGMVILSNENVRDMFGEGVVPEYL